MKRQFEILNEICECIFSTSTEFDSLKYTYKFNPDEGWRGTESHATRDGRHVLLNLNESTTDRIKNLCQELHSEMQSQTGGDWRKFILTLDENGEAKTQFIYEVQSCMDEFDED